MSFGFVAQEKELIQKNEQWVREVNLSVLQ